MASSASVSTISSMSRLRDSNFSVRRRRQACGLAACLFVLLAGGGPDGSPPHSLLLHAAAAEDWPQFRGPTGQGHSSESGLPVEWSETSNIVWKTRVPGTGWSSPVVAGGK